MGAVDIKHFLGIDIGGTNTKVGVFDPHGELLGFAEGDTPAEGGVEAEMGLLGEILDFLQVSPEQFHAIGVGVPGPVDKNGIVHSPPNLKGWGVVDLGKVLSEYLNFPREKIAIGNDANFAALAEYEYGRGRGADPMVMLTLGTGVGGAVIINGELLTGRDGFAAELGHIVIDPDGPRCGCGRRGCAEALISHTGIVRTAWFVLEKDKGSIIWSMIEGQFGELSPKVVQEAAEAGDPAANKILTITARHLGTLLADLVNIFNPEKIVIGGGISRWGKALLEPAEKFMRRQALKHLAERVSVVRAKFYQKAGVIGAAVAAMRIHQRAK